MKQLLIILFFSINIFSVFSKTEVSQEFHPKRIIIKFSANSTILTKLKKIVPVAISESYYVKDNTLTDQDLNKFFSEFKINSIKAVKPVTGSINLAGGIDRIFIVEIENGLNLNEVINTLSYRSFIEYAERDYIGNGSGIKAETLNASNYSSVIPNDPYFGLQWGLRNTGQVVNGVTGIPGADINIAGGWDITTGNATLKVGILDSGIPPGASEFSGRITPGYDFANNDTDPTDDQGHGTNVTSIAAAKGNNGSLVTGVNWNCKIMPVKILNSSNSGFYSWWISGITMAADSGAKVMNMSVGGNSYSQGLQDAITYANSLGAIIVACMMNNNNNVPYYPAGFSNVISIGAINNQNKRAVPFCWGGGSSYGSHIDFCAPGEMILGLDAFNPNSVNYWCGTSQATPMVTGLISLMLSINPTLTFNQVYDKIKQNAVDMIGPPNEDSLGFDSYFGWGRINAQATLNSIPVSVTNYSSNVPGEFSLHQNYPNPFNPVTKIKFDIAKSNFTSIVIFDALGREVYKLLNEELNPGSYEVTWNASKNSSGIYYYKLISGSFAETKMMTVIK